MSASPYVLRGDKQRTSLDKLHDQIAALLGEREAIAASPITADEFNFRIARGLERGSALATRVQSQLHDHPAAPLAPREPLTLADLAWLLGPEEMATRLYGASREYLAARPAPIDAPSRASRAAQIDLQLDELQTQEEVLVLSLFDAGIRVTRRENVDPYKILAIWQKEA